MTVLGKILVIVNLVFSLVTAFLIVTVYSTRTNWKVGYDKAVSELKVARADRDAHANRRETAEKAQDEANKAREKALAEHAKTKEEFAAKEDALKKQIQAEQQNARNADRNASVAAAESSNRQEEVRKLHALLKEREQAVVRLEQEKKDLRDQKVSFEIASHSEQERNEMLARQLEVMSKEQERVRTGGEAAPTGRAGADNPPPEEIEGLVKDIDTQSGYVTITLGSDAGLKVGNTLHVFRLRPNAQYLGTIRIVNLNAQEAVARPVTPLRHGLIKVGDRVASKI